jgi:hypothetical protein
MAKVKALNHKELKALGDKFRDSIWVEDGAEYDHEYEGPCNCWDCLMERTMELQSTFLLAEVYPKLGTMPRNYDRNDGYNNARGDWRYADEPEEVIYYLAKALNEIRVYNQKLRDSQKEKGVSTKSWKYCYDCGRLHKRGKTNSFTFDEEKVSFCGMCVNKYTTCDTCNNPAEINLIYSIFKEAEVYHQVQSGAIPQKRSQYHKVCSTCYSVWGAYCCNICGYQGPEDQFKVDGRQIVCLHCHELYARECSICNQISYDTNGGRGNFVCYNCQQARKVYHGHDYRPSVFNFMTAETEGKRDTSKDLFFGFELEIESASSWITNQEAMAALIVEKVGAPHIYCVHDGTLNHGIEVVTHPFTWEHYRTIGRTMWDEMLLFCRSYEWSADSYGDGSQGPGFHIHTTKAAWGTYQLYKLLQLGYNKKNRDFFITIAGRKPTRYCSINPTDIKEAPIVAKGKKNRSRDHYAMINLNSSNGASSKTVEFRLFAGSLEPLIVHKNIEFVRACYMFTRDFNLKSMTKDVFTRYIKANRKQYPHLCEYLTMKGI